MALNSQNPKTGNAEFIKRLNSVIVYRTIANNEPISRISIAEKTQLAPASVTKITRLFLQAGLIKETEEKNTTGGRPAISIVTVTKPFHAIAVQLSRKNITLELYNIAGKSLAFHQEPHKSQNQSEIETFLIDKIADFIAQNQKKIQKLIAISVVMPGLVDAQTGVVNYMPSIQVEKWQLRNVLSEHFNLPCFIGHDIRSLALAEHYFGATKHCEDSVLIRIHRGIGTGIIFNNQLLIGKNQYAGEIGHIQVDPLGERCHCGNFGCLESVVSNDVIHKRAAQLLQQGRQSQLTLEKCKIADICEAANLGDSLAVELIQNIAHHLGKIIAMMLNTLNPQKFVIAGDITLAESILFPAIESVLKHQVLNPIHQNTELVSSQLVHRSAIGAFALVKRAMLNGELLQYLLDH